MPRIAAAMTLFFSVIPYPVGPDDIRPAAIQPAALTVRNIIRHELTVGRFDDRPAPRCSSGSGRHQSSAGTAAMVADLPRRHLVQLLPAARRYRLRDDEPAAEMGLGHAAHAAIDVRRRGRNFLGHEPARRATRPTRPARVPGALPRSLHRRDIAAPGG